MISLRQLVKMLGFHEWLVSTAGVKHTDEAISFFIDYFSRRKGSSSTNGLLLDGNDVTGFKSLESVIDRFVPAGRPTTIVEFSDKKERGHGFERDRESLTLIV